jgi:hypothetical protein
MLTDFYVAFSTVCFTLLGLWIIVVRPAMASGATARSIDGGPMGSPCTSRCPVHHAALHGLNLRDGLMPVDILHRQARPPITQTRDRLRDRGRRAAPKLAASSSSRPSAGERPVRKYGTFQTRREHLESAVPLDRIQTPPSLGFS